MKKNCTIIIFNYNSLGFLKLCVKQIRKNTHPEIECHILIADQSNEEENKKIVEEFDNSMDITIVPMKALRSGYAVDFIMRNVEIKTDYVCTLDCDFFITNKNWLSLSITLLEENNYSFVGELFFESRAEETAYYHKNIFFCMSQCFRVGKTETYKEISMNGGFTILHARPETGFEYLNNDWLEWAKEDYINKGSDDGVIAHCWEDNHTENSKLSLAITHILGEQGIESGYGRVLDGIGFHFGFSYWSNGIEDKVGKKYGYWKQRIENMDENVLEDMLAEVKSANPEHPSGTQTRRWWDGKLKQSFLTSGKLNKRIEELKNN